MGYLRVQLGNSLLVLREVIESAVVRLRVTMLGAEDVGAFAGHLDQADFFVALPAEILFRLSEKKRIKFG